MGLGIEHLVIFLSRENPQHVIVRYIVGESATPDNKIYIGSFTLVHRLLLFYTVLLCCDHATRSTVMSINLGMGQSHHPNLVPNNARVVVNGLTQPLQIPERMGRRRTRNKTLKPNDFDGNLIYTTIMPCPMRLWLHIV